MGCFLLFKLKLKLNSYERADSGTWTVRWTAKFLELPLALRLQSRTCFFFSAWAASIDGESERGGVGGRPGESWALDVGAVLVDLVVAVLRVHDEDAAHAESLDKNLKWSIIVRLLEKMLYGNKKEKLIFVKNVDISLMCSMTTLGLLSNL